MTNCLKNILLLLLGMVAYALGRWRQKFNANWGYIVRPCFKRNKTKNNQKES
jgi:hypothetical protein